MWYDLIIIKTIALNLDGLAKMRLSNDQLIFFCNLCESVYTLCVKYSDLDVIDDPLVIAFVDYLTYGEGFDETYRIFQNRGIPFDKDRILECIDNGETLDGKSHKTDLHLAYTCKIVRKFGKEFKDLYTRIWNYNKWHDSKYDDFLEAALQYYQVRDAFTSSQFYDPLYDKRNEIIKENKRKEMLNKLDYGIDFDSYK